MSTLQLSNAQFQAPADTHRASLRTMVEAAFRQKRAFFWASSVTMLLALLWIFGTHKKYGSDMTLLVQNARGNEVITAEKTTGTPLLTEVSEEQLNSEAEILRSKDILDEVIDPGWSKIPASQRSQAQVDEHEAAVLYFDKHLKITPVKKSHLIEVNVRALTPERATEQAERLLAAFLAKQRSLNRPAGTTQFFAEAAERYRREWEKSEAKLNAYQQAHAIVSPHDKETELEQEISDMDAQMRAADVQVSEIEHRIAGDVAELRATPQREKTLQRKIPDAGSVDQLSAMLVQLKNQRTELLTKYVPTDRLVKQVDEQIASTSEALSRAQAGAFAEDSSNINPTWQAVDENLSEKRAELQAAKARRAGLVAQLGSLQKELSATEGDEVEFQNLQHEVADAEQNYQLYSQKRDQAQISDAMDARQFLNVGVAQSPTYSTTPVHPRPVLDTLLALFSSLFVGAFAIFVAESGRQTFANAHEVEQAFPFAVLATVPLARALPAGESASLPPSARVSILTAVSRGTSRLKRANLLRLW